MIDDPIGRNQAPARYTGSAREAIDIIRDQLGDTGFVSWCIGNSLKYLSRAGRKGPAEEDEAKARFYEQMARHVTHGDCEDPRSERPSFASYRQVIDSSGVVFIDQAAVVLSSTPDAARLIEAAGRTCYRSEERIGPGTARAFVSMLRRRGHMSVLEHASATLRLTTDRGVTHELVRHRVASYSQESTRYCDYSGSLRFVRPVGLAHVAQWEAAMVSAAQQYRLLRDLNERPEQARSVLPNSLATEIVVTANFREWLHILDLRTDVAAHPQMRVLMGLVEGLLIDLCPEVFVKPLPGGVR